MGRIYIDTDKPNFDWTCPFCNRHATITKESLSESFAYLGIDNADGPRALFTLFVVCPNTTCKKFTLKVSLFKAVRDNAGGLQQQHAAPPIRKWSLIPSSCAQSFPSYIPKPILDDYGEACLIRDLSPRASATLSRRCLQGIIRDFWQVQVKSGRLVDEIAAIKNKVDPLTWQAIEAVRKIGNIGAHMEADINLIIDVEPQEAQLLIGLIESLLRDWYVARKTREEHLSSLIQLAADKADEKKQKSTAP